MPDNSKLVIRYAVGRSTNFGKAENKTISWKQLCTKFAKPIRTGERYRDYVKLPDKEQVQLKAVNGWWYRTQIDGKMRNRGSGLPSDLISLDFDYATPEFFEAVLSGELLPGWELFLHTSRRHTPENPRFRVVIPVSKPIPNDLYVPVSRIICQQIDREMSHVDKVSFRPAQMMFMPTASKDGEYVFHHQQGELLDWSVELDTFELHSGDWRDIANLPKAADENALRDTSEKAEDPTEKQGVVGDFCRAYDVVQAIDAFDLPYEPVSEHSGKPRYTYTGGTTTNGAEVQDEGLFLYSHHGSDPVSDMLVNAFDLVRLHKFADADKGFDSDGKKITQYPSYKAMIEFISEDPAYKAELVKSRYDVNAMFDDLWDEDQIEIEDSEIDDLVGKPEDAKKVNGTPVLSDYARKHLPKPPDDWVQKLEYTQNGNIIPTVSNIAQIVQNDLRVRNSIEFNEFTNRVVTREPIKSKLPYLPVYYPVDTISGDPWQDYHQINLRIILEAPNGPGKQGWGVKTTDRDLDGAVETAARRNVFHPVREHLSSLLHDGQARAETLWIDYMGSPDTPYYRETARKFLIGAVARVFEPGSKFDFVPILHGAQGKRKSSFIAALAMEWYGELKGNFSDDKHMIEQMIGCFMMELPELSSITRSVIEDVKAFISGTESTVRLSYDRRPSTFKRQCVFIGSTNDTEFLIDHTGNRRWWPIEVKTEFIDVDRLKRNLDQIWAEAVQMYLAMRAEQPHGDLPLYLVNEESQREAIKVQEKARMHTEADFYAEMISVYLDQMVDIEDDFTAAAAGRSPRKRHRFGVHLSQIWTEALDNENKSDQGKQRALVKALKACGWEAAGYSARIPEHPQSGPAWLYVPSAEVEKRWKREDDPDLGGLV